MNATSRTIETHTVVITETEAQAMAGVDDTYKLEAVTISRQMPPTVHVILRKET